jgi:ADP-heptose:LPS heptosyltransferase
VNRVLVLNHHGIGDVLMSFPACRWLAAELGEVMWMTVKGPAEKQICENERCGSNFVQFALSRNRPLEVAKTLWKLRRLHIDKVLALYGYKSGMVANFSRLIGAKEWFCHPIDEKSQFDRGTIHKRYLHLNIVKDWLERPIPEGQDKDFLFDQLDFSVANVLADAGDYIVLIPGSGEREAFKRWPVERFIAFSKLFTKRFPAIQVVITGTSNESYLGDAIKEGSNGPQIKNLCGKLSLRQLAGVFRQACVVLGGDSGGLHIAKAAGGRVAAIMGPTNSALTGPIEPSLIIDLQLPGTPWYCRKTLNDRAYSIDEPSMQVSAEYVLENLLEQGLF